jgi:hypothetical protein
MNSIHQLTQAYTEVQIKAEELVDMKDTTSNIKQDLQLLTG